MLVSSLNCIQFYTGILWLCVHMHCVFDKASFYSFFVMFPKYVWMNGHLYIWIKEWCDGYYHCCFSTESWMMNELFVNLCLYHEFKKFVEWRMYVYFFIFLLLISILLGACICQMKYIWMSCFHVCFVFLWFVNHINMQVYMLIFVIILGVFVWFNEVIKLRSMPLVWLSQMYVLCSPNGEYFLSHNNYCCHHTIFLNCCYNWWI